MTLVIASTLAEALAALADGARPIAGGTDLMVGARQGKAPLPKELVAIDRLGAEQNSDLGTITKTQPGGVRIGALVPHQRLMTDPIIVANATALADSAALIGSPATRHLGTLGGNVMNASPAMDTGAPLAVLGATITLRSQARGERHLRLDELLAGPGQTTAEADELCTDFELPARPERAGSAYVRLEYRRAMEIAVVGAAASVTLDEAGNIETLAVALSAAAPTILQVTGLEALIGQPAAALDEAKAAVAEAASTQSKPIGDLRASDRYRRHTVGVMAVRALEAAVARAHGEPIAVPINRSVGIGAA